MKLLHLVGPAHLYLGQKDAQRVVVIRRMLADLFAERRAGGLPVMRDPDGLAVSAANMGLSIEERHAATCLYAASPRRRRPTTPASGRPRSCARG